MTSAPSQHAISIEAEPGRVRVMLGGVAIADSTRALVLREGRLPPVHYVPREDVDAGAISRTAHRSHCPFKGDASYFALSGGGVTVENAAWSYEQPFPAAAAIRGHLAFYANKVDVIEVSNG
ncbi:MAG TPA: DUF427 domain-containing protein [Rhodospirillales bacterium]|nr:DUF427 domain-containing protein [Rhodospirillales bacterium]